MSPQQELLRQQEGKGERWFHGSSRSEPDAYGASTALGTPPNAEEEEEDEEEIAHDEGIVYETNGEIYVSVELDEVRIHFTRAKDRHRDPVGYPQEWFGIIVPNRILRIWTADKAPAPPKGWIQDDGWDTQDPNEVKGQYLLNLHCSVERSLHRARHQH